jgi:hypothetical protein
MNDRPTAGELVQAVRLFLETELLGGVSDPRLRYHTLVAANVLAIASREMAGEEDRLREEWRLLAGVLGEGGAPPAEGELLRRGVRGLNERLSAAIRAGAFDAAPRQGELAGVLRALVVRKLEVANPRYLQSVANPGAGGKPPA